ncbi:MAG: hypothetical protein IAE98_11810, partial [Candidatus Kapabacteria bacterium]|nr:hypothetical protein [Candidatus Kapabacteria bacterium]
MKSTTLTLMLLFIANFHIVLSQEYETTFEWLFPKPHGGVINDIAFNESEIFIAGNSGLLMKSPDDGKNWIMLNDKEFKNFNKVYFINNEIGFLVTDDNKIYRSIDGGNRWYFVDVYPDYIIHKILFTNSNTGWIIAENKQDQEWNILLKTENAGSTWEKIDLQSILPDSDEYADVLDIYFLDSLNGWIASWYAIYRTYDGGLTWQILNDKLRWFEILHFNDDKNGWCIRDRKLYNTSDGGINWTEIESPARLYDFYSVSNNHIYVKTYDDWFSSYDGGKNWDTLKISNTYNGDIRKIAFRNNANGYAIDDNLNTTSDGGKSWVKVINEIIPGVQHMKMFSDNLGFLISWDNLLYSTTNGGESWTQRSSKTDFYPRTFGGDFKSLHAFDENNIWAFNWSNELGFSSNGGASWTMNNEFKNVFSPILKKIQFINSTHGWIVGSLGTLINTTDGGKKWNSRELPTKNQFTDVSFVNENYGWVLDFAGKVFFTTNGGTSWDNRNIDPNYKKYFVSIEFDDINNGRILADDAFYSSNNGGLSWRKSDLSKYGINLKSSSFVGDFGIIVGDDSNFDRSTNSLLLYTTDYGRTWNKLAEAPQSDYVKLFKDNTFLLGRASNSNGLLKYNLKVKAGITEPNLLAPLNNAKKIDSQAMLEARTNDNVYHEFQISADSGFEDLLLSRISTTNNITYDKFDLQKKYYWRARVLSWDEVSPWSNTWSFNTKIPVPELVSPSVNTEAVSYTHL